MKIKGSYFPSSMLRVLSITELLQHLPLLAFSDVCACVIICHHNCTSHKIIIAAKESYNDFSWCLLLLFYFYKIIIKKEKKRNTHFFACRSWFYLYFYLTLRHCVRLVVFDGNCVTFVSVPMRIFQKSTKIQQSLKYNRQNIIIIHCCSKKHT